jgi:hypothetical protein
LSDAAPHLSRPYDLYLLYRQSLLLSGKSRGGNPDSPYLLQVISP